MQTYHSFLAVLREAKDGVSILVVKIIKEDAATASSFIVAVFDHKVVITPLLELGPVLRVVLLTNSLSSHTLSHHTGTSDCYINLLHRTVTSNCYFGLLHQTVASNCCVKLLRQIVASNCSIRHSAQVVTCRPLIYKKCCQHLSSHCKKFAAT